MTALNFIICSCKNDRSNAIMLLVGELMVTVAAFISGPQESKYVADIPILFSSRVNSPKNGATS